MPRKSSASSNAKKLPPSRKPRMRLPGTRVPRPRIAAAAAQPGIIGSGIRAAGSFAGRLLGSPFGAGDTFSAIGRALGGKLSRLLGSGDYTVAGSAAVNSLIAGGKPDAGASFGSSHDIVRIRHREYISDLYTGPTAGIFSNNTLSVNPGLSTTFPYLAPIASNFEEYRFRGLVFEFVSSTSPFLAGGAMGTLVAAMQYNPLAEPFSNKPQMENSDYAVSARFDTNLMYGVECKEFTQNSYLVRYGDSAPLTAYDVGTFQFASAPGSTFPVNSTIGELWVSYDIELMRPRISQARFGIGHLRYSMDMANAQNVMPVPVIRSAMGVIADLVVSNYVVGYPAATNNGITISGLSTGDIISVTFAATAPTATGVLSLFGVTGLSEFRILSGNTHHQWQSATTHPIAIAYWVVTAPPGTPCTFFLNSAGITSADVIVEAMGNGLQASAT